MVCGPQAPQTCNLQPALATATCETCATHQAQRPSRKHRRALGAEAQARRVPRSALGLSGLNASALGVSRPRALGPGCGQRLRRSGLGALALRPQRIPGHWALGMASDLRRSGLGALALGLSRPQGTGPWVWCPRQALGAEARARRAPHAAERVWCLRTYQQLPNWQVTPGHLARHNS